MQNYQIIINPSSIPYGDRSVHYGDASFTTMYAQDRRIALLDQHIRRLQNACERLGFAFSAWPSLKAALSEVAESCILPSTIKITLSRGSGGRGYQAPSNPQIMCMIHSQRTEAMLTQKNIEILGVSEVILPQHSGLAEMKHNNRLAQVLARNAATELGFDEALMCDDRQHVIEATSSNVFYKLDGCWHTPSLQTGGVRGVMRDAFLAYLQGSGCFVNHASHCLQILLGSEYVLLCNAVKGIRSVRQIEYNGKRTKFNNDTDELVRPFLRSVLACEQVS